MKEFAITFGEKYLTETHPSWALAHPEGYLVVEAPSWDHARLVALERLGREWSFIYPMTDFRNKYLFPRGELGRWKF
jgi:hypothetical protein